MNVNENLMIGGILALVGLFCIICSVKDYNWFFEHRKAKLLVRLFGRKGARIFYLALGVFIVCLSAVIMLFLQPIN